jgi:hypothetical protein
MGKFEPQVVDKPVAILTAFRGEAPLLGQQVDVVVHQAGVGQTEAEASAVARDQAEEGSPAPDRRSPRARGGRPSVGHGGRGSDVEEGTVAAQPVPTFLPPRKGNG